ncbi:hypothetical protein [Reichenbachiella sp. MSK19-1]|uniref:hypothetical protein n=1 Tax=Reichenbachiella sp. MSK19-1 TaxID=1897631 RepID=UPI000E6CC977|nr:hypothetical protein [Reichenbachiella sp. MSK19-1]RJE74491.1 hypothetical protein BGP76_15175 [Reichenbachiella sp. MSK19-1]
MKFLNKVYVVILASVLAFSCDPLEDAYNEIEEIEALEGSDESFDYQMVSEDYGTIASTIRSKSGVTEEDSVAADFIEDNEAFSTTYEAKNYLPSFVDDNFGQFEKGTAVKVNYSFFAGDLPDYSVYLDADNYRVSSDDYKAYSSEAGVNGFFDNSVDTDAYMLEFVTSKVQDPSSGDVVSATYNYVDVLYSDLTGEVVFEEAFEEEVDGLGAFTAVSVTGDQGWAWDAYGGATWAKMSGYAGGSNANEDWLVSEAIDMSDAEGDVSLKLTHILNYLSDETWGEELDIKFSTDYSGDVATATWTSLEFDQYPEGNSWTEVDAVADIPDVQGEDELYIAFYYTSTASASTTWEVVSIEVEVGAAPEIKAINGFYSYNGSAWSSMEDEVHYFGSYDYAAMGAPGQYNNFSASEPSYNYVPQYLSQNIAYAQEGDQYDVVFYYYDGTGKTLAETYTYTDGVWTGTFYTEMVEQYVHNGTSFVFDPSVAFTMSTADYQIIVDEVKKTKPDLLDSYGTAEFYYGAGAYYENFDLGYTSRASGDYMQDEFVGLSASETSALMIQRMGEGIEVLLEVKYSDAQPVAGVDVLYSVKCDSYDGTDATWLTVFQLTAVGEFELVEGPTKQ